MATVEQDRASEEADRGDGLLVGKDFDVGQAGRVVDRDMHRLPAADVRRRPSASVRLGRPLRPYPAGDPFAGAILDEAELLDVDVGQLARTGAFAADRGLQPETTELAQPVALEDRADRRARHVEQIRELRCREPQPAQRREQLDCALIGAVVNPVRGAGAIEQTRLAFRPVTVTHFEQVRPLTSAASAAFAIGQPCSTTRNTIRSRCLNDRAALACNLIRCPPWDWGLQHHPASREARMNNVPRNYI